MAYFIIDFATAFPKKPEPIVEAKESKRDIRSAEEVKMAQQKKLELEKQHASYPKKIAEWKKVIENLLGDEHSIIIISNPPEDAQQVLAEMGLSEEDLDDIEFQTELTPPEEEVKEAKIRTIESPTLEAVPHVEEVALGLFQSFITNPTEASRIEFMDLADIIRIKMISHDELVEMKLVDPSLLFDTRPLDPAGLLQTPTTINRDLLALSAKANPNVITALFKELSEVKLEELLNKIALMDPSILVRIRTMNPTELMRVKASEDDPFPNMTLAESMKIKMIEPIRLLQTTHRSQLANIPEKPLEDLPARLKAVNSAQLRDRLKQMDPAEIARIRNMDVAELLLIKARPVILPEIKLHQPEQKLPPKKTEIVMRAASVMPREVVVLIGDKSFAAGAKRALPDFVSANTITPDTRDFLTAIATRGRLDALREAREYHDYSEEDQLITPLEQTQSNISFDLGLEEKEPPKTLVQRFFSLFTGWFPRPKAKAEAPTPLDEEQVRLLAEIDKAIDEKKQRMPQGPEQLELRGGEIRPVERRPASPKVEAPTTPRISEKKSTTTSLKEVLGPTEFTPFPKMKFKEIKLPLTPTAEENKKSSLQEMLEAKGLSLPPKSEWGKPLASSSSSFVLSDETQLKVRRIAHQANRLVETAERRFKAATLNIATRDALDFYLDPYRQLAKLGIALTTPEAKEALKTAIEQGHFKDMSIEIPDPKDPNQTIAYTVENFDQIPPEALFKFFIEFTTKLLENYDACERFLADHLKFQMDPKKYGKEVYLPSLQEVSEVSPQVQYTFALSTEPNVTQQNLEDFVREASLRKHRDQQVRDLDAQISKLKLDGKNTPANQSIISALRGERDTLTKIKSFAGLKDIIRRENARLGYMGSFFHLLRATPLERLSQQVEYDVHSASRVAQRSFSAPAADIYEARRTRTPRKG